MKAEPSTSSSKDWRVVFLGCILAATLVYFFVFCKWLHVHSGPISTLNWLITYLTVGDIHWRHWWLTLLAITACSIHSVGRMKTEPIVAGGLGLIWIAAGMLLWVEAAHSRFVRLSIFSLPLLILGCVHFAVGWKRARHLAFPLSLVLLLVPFPIDRLTNILWEPTDWLAAHVFQWIGGEHYHGRTGFLGSRRLVNFTYLIPVLLVAALWAKFNHRSIAGRMAVVCFSMPAVMLTEAVHAAVSERLSRMDSAPLHNPFVKVIEFVLILWLAAACLELISLFSRKTKQQSTENRLRT
jgi:hypothetical protein